MNSGDIHVRVWQLDRCSRRRGCTPRGIIWQRGLGGISFVWLYSLIAAVLYAPLIVVLLLSRPIASGAVQLLFVAVSSVLQLVYFPAADQSLSGGRSVAGVSAGAGGADAGDGGSDSAAGRASIAAGVKRRAADRAGHFRAAGRSAQAASIRRGAGRPVRGADRDDDCHLYAVGQAGEESVYGIPPLLLDWGANVLRIILMVPLVASRRPAVLTRVERSPPPGDRDRRAGTIGLHSGADSAEFQPGELRRADARIQRVDRHADGRAVAGEGDTRRRLTGAAVIVGGVIAIGLG